MPRFDPHQPKITLPESPGRCTPNPPLHHVVQLYHTPGSPWPHPMPRSVITGCCGCQLGLGPPKRSWICCWRPGGPPQPGRRARRRGPRLRNPPTPQPGSGSARGVAIKAERRGENRRKRGGLPPDRAHPDNSGLDDAHPCHMPLISLVQCMTSLSLTVSLALAFSPPLLLASPLCVCLARARARVLSLSPCVTSLSLCASLSLCVCVCLSRSLAPCVMSLSL